MSGLFGSTAAAATTNAAQGDLSKDIPLKDPPEDSISEIMFSPQSEHLAVASWDKKVRVYEISNSGDSQGKALFEHDGPVLACCWSKDGTKVVGAGADKQAKLLDLAGNTTTAQQVAQHEQPISCARFVDVQGAAGPILATGSWDKTLKYWDLRSPNPVATVQCQDRVYTMDTREKLLVVGTADRYIDIINLNDPGKFYKTAQSPLKWQTRCVSCFPDATGYGVGSIEGRCGIQYVEDKDNSHNFSFKCHRQTPQGQPNQSNVFSVNAISWHPEHGTFSTAGSDGTFHFWDKDAKHRLKGYPEVGGTISSTCFNRNGQIFAYAVSYDWSKGFSANTPQTPNKVMMHPVQPEECKPRAKTAKR